MIKHFRKGLKFVIENRRFPTITEIRKYFKVRKVIMPLPEFAQIEITTKCNFRCFTCSRRNLSKNRLNRDMTLEEFKHILYQIPSLKHVKLQGLGEPFLSKNISDILLYAKFLKKVTSTITNGSILPEVDVLKLLDVITISFDSANKEYFESIRSGSNFDLIIENIKFLISMKKENKIKSKICLNSVVTHLNFHEVEKIIETASRLGIDGIGIVEVENWYTPLEREYEDAFNFISRSREISKKLKYIIESLKIKYQNNIKINYQVSSRRKLTCLWPFYSVFITVDGYITPCCIRMNPEVFNFGNIYNISFHEIWNGEHYIYFRDANISNKKNLVCDNCPD